MYCFTAEGLAWAQKMGITATSTLLAMMHLMQHDHVTMTELAKACGHSTATITGMVDRLSKLDLVERVKSTADRRSYYVTLTDKGRFACRQSLTPLPSHDA